MPSLRHCSVGRREGPSMAQRGYPGIHAGMPTAQCLRSAVVVNGALRSKAKAKARRPDSPSGSGGCTSIQLWSGLAREGVSPDNPNLWRGSLLPLGCVAVAKPAHAVCLEKCRGLLRRPAGASSLATVGLCGAELGIDPSSLVGASLLAMAVLRRVHVRCCGNGHLGFRPYGGLLSFKRQRK